MRHQTSNFRLFFLSLFTFALAVSACVYWIQKLQVEIHSANLMSRSPSSVGVASYTPSGTAQVFTTKRTTHLRNYDLRTPQILPRGTQITIEPDFLKEAFGTDQPSNSDIERLMLNPEQVFKERNKRFTTSSVIDADTGQKISDYFFPVIITKPDGTPGVGKMALQSYLRNDIVTQPYGATEKTDALKNQNTTTDGGYCVNCASDAKENFRKIEISARKSEAAKPIEKVTTISSELWNEYLDFARAFTAKYKRINNTNAGNIKRVFLAEMIAKLGIEKTGKIIQILTSFGEVPHRNDNNTQIAELAAVQQVITNRSKDAYYKKVFNKSRTLEDLRIKPGTNELLTASLANAQFSVWNDSDNSLARILSFNPDKSDDVSRRRMALAFETAYKMEKNEIELSGALGGDVFHYHANYVVPSWSKASRKIADPIVKITDEEGMITTVKLNNQKGARHVFYSGRL